MNEQQSTQELRELFQAWFAASAAKDLDAVMEPIAKDIESYEHEAPLQYRGVDSLRETCRQGFEYMKGDFTWDIPDLKILVRGDLAVTWGLNHMQALEPGQPRTDHWSRGTRIFQKIDGRWKMIHQHVSYPYDPLTGKTRTDLALD